MPAFSCMTNPQDPAIEQQNGIRDLRYAPTYFSSTPEPLIK